MRTTGPTLLLFSILFLNGCSWFIGYPTMVTDLGVGAEAAPVRPAIGSAVEAPIGTIPGHGAEEPEAEAKPDGYYEDDHLSVTWHLYERWFGLTLVNKTGHSMHIAWDEALVVVDTHWERLIDRTRPLPQKPTVVDPGSSVSLKAAPLSRLMRYDSKSGGYWRCIEGPLGKIPRERQSRSTIRRLAKDAVGHRFKVLLPLEIAGKRIDYLFTITVTKAGLYVAYA